MAKYAVHVAWITGAGSGIGRALRLAERGTTVWISARNAAALVAVAKRAATGRILPLALDVTDRTAAAEDAAEQVYARIPLLRVVLRWLRRRLSAA